MTHPAPPDEGGEAPCYAHLLPAHGAARPAVLFVCADDAGLALMAARLAVLLSAGRVEARSAGMNPAATVRADVVDVMAEVGLDLSRTAPTAYAPAMLAGVDLAVFMGCGPPEGSGLPAWELTLPDTVDPVGVRLVRDRVRDRVRDLLGLMDVRVVHVP